MTSSYLTASATTRFPHTVTVSDTQVSAWTRLFEGAELATALGRSMGEMLATHSL